MRRFLIALVLVAGPAFADDPDLAPPKPPPAPVSLSPKPAATESSSRPKWKPKPKPKAKAPKVRSPKSYPAQPAYIPQPAPQPAGPSAHVVAEQAGRLEFRRFQASVIGPHDAESRSLQAIQVRTWADGYRMGAAWLQFASRCLQRSNGFASANRTVGFLNQTYGAEAATDYRNATAYLRAINARQSPNLDLSRRYATYRAAQAAVLRQHPSWAQ